MILLSRILASCADGVENNSRAIGVLFGRGSVHFSNQYLEYVIAV